MTKMTLDNVWVLAPLTKMDLFKVLWQMLLHVSPKLVLSRSQCKKMTFKEFPANIFISLSTRCLAHFTDISFYWLWCSVCVHTVSGISWTRVTMTLKHLKIALKQGWNLIGSLVRQQRPFAIAFQTWITCISCKSA